MKEMLTKYVPILSFVLLLGITCIAPAKAEEFIGYINIVINENKHGTYDYQFINRCFIACTSESTL